jgi:hypothetical protein
MKLNIFLFSIYSLLFGINPANSQGFVAPSPGKAVVYIVRVTDNGLTTSVEYFHQDKYIGIFKGKNYMRYECNPGKNLIWSSCENKDFVTADLKEGGTYILIVDVYTGAVKYRVKLVPITEKDTQLFKQARKLINSRPPIETPKSKIDQMNIQLADFIKTRLDQYETDWKFTNDYKSITPEMNISAEAMK